MGTAPQMCVVSMRRLFRRGLRLQGLCLGFLIKFWIKLDLAGFANWAFSAACRVKALLWKD